MAMNTRLNFRISFIAALLASLRGALLPAGLRRRLGRRLLGLVLLREEDRVPLEVEPQVRDERLTERGIVRLPDEALYDRPPDLGRGLQPHLDVAVRELARRLRADVAVL